MNSSLRPGKTFASVIFSILILTASANAGLMYNLTLEGSKISRIDR
jgi:hypothetical protein